MAIKRQFDDPLASIDPVMQQAFSASDTDIESGPVISQLEFPQLTPDPNGKHLDENIFGQIPVSVSVELGRTKLPLKTIMELTEGSIIELDRLMGEPLDLVVNGQIIAQGEVVAVDNHYGIRLSIINAKLS